MKTSKKCNHCRMIVELNNKDINKRYEVELKDDYVCVGSETIAGPPVPWHSGCCSIGWNSTGKVIEITYLNISFKCPSCGVNTIIYDNGEEYA